MKNVLVLGGSGFVGRHVCEALNRAGVHVTVVTRRLPARSVQMLPLVTVVQADVHDVAALHVLLPGHDAVVNLVAILHGDRAAFDKVHVQLPRQLAHACVQTGVLRMVHVSALGQTCMVRRFTNAAKRKVKLHCNPKWCMVCC